MDRRRMVLGLGATALAVLGGGRPPVSAKKKKARKKTYVTKVVTRSFESKGVIWIASDGPANPYPATIEVSGFRRGRIKDVDVTLRNVTHANFGHLDILLVSPAGKATLLSSDLGWGAVNDKALTFDDQAAIALPVNGPLQSGAYRPANLLHGDLFPAPAPQGDHPHALSVFDGTKPNGAWRLFIVDAAEGGSGHLAGGWTLEITATVRIRQKGKP